MITSKMHGYLDYVTVLFFLLAPSLFNLSEVGTLLAYTLSGVHLLITISTAFPAGIASLIPFQIHGYVELVVGIVLTGGTWLFNDLFLTTGQLMFSICGIVILGIWTLTAYKSPLTKSAQ